MITYFSWHFPIPDVGRVGLLVHTHAFVTITMCLQGAQQQKRVRAGRQVHLICLLNLQNMRRLRCSVVGIRCSVFGDGDLSPVGGPWSMIPDFSPGPGLGSLVVCSTLADCVSSGISIGSSPNFSWCCMYVSAAVGSLVAGDTSTSTRTNFDSTDLVCPAFVLITVSLP